MSDPFPETRWSLVLTGGTDEHARTTAMEALARTYWRPVYGYVRARTRGSDEDALDATQAFFLWILEVGFLDRADPERGRFRGFVKVTLERFLTDRVRAANTEKRGGAHRFLPIRGPDGDTLELPNTHDQSPEDALDQLWRAGLVERAFERLRARMEADGKTKQFAVFEDQFLGAEDLGYEALADRHGVSKVDVSNWLMRTKARFREELRGVVLETVNDARDLDDELQWLFETP